MATAICCIANDGILVQPKIIKQVTNTDTGATTNIDTTVIRQVVSKETSENLLNMMESVVTSGTGRYGRVTGYSVAGKPEHQNHHQVQRKMDMLRHILLFPL